MSLISQIKKNLNRENKRNREREGNKRISTFIHRMLIMLSIRRTLLCINFLWYPGLI